MKQVVMFMDRRCPVCFRLEPMLADLCIRRGLEFTKVDIRSGAGSLMGRYRWFLDRAFGGEENVPVVLVGEERWYVPRRTTRPGRGGGEPTREDIEEACAALVREVERDLDRRERVYPPTHGQLRLGATAWRPSTS